MLKRFKSVDDMKPFDPLKRSGTTIFRTGLAQKAQPLNLWVGTFNLAYKDPFEAEIYYRELLEWVPEKQDIYVLGVQEAVSEGVYSAMHLVFQHRGEEFTRLPFYSKVYGRGDGAIMSAKFTGLAIFARKSLLDNEYV